MNLENESKSNQLHYFNKVIENVRYFYYILSRVTCNL